jgi:ATP-dependent helicase HrpB
VRRLWDETDRLRPHQQPEIHRVDLSDPALDILAWGGDPLAFEWFDPPSAERIEAALALLRQLGAVRDGRITELGRRMNTLPLHPRLARMLLESNGHPDVATACALLAERQTLPRGTADTTSSDLLSAIDRRDAIPQHVRDVARRIADLARGGSRSGSSAVGDAGFLRAVFTGYPDRAARRREPGSPRFLLASGHGAVLARESGVRDAEFVVAVDVHAGRRGEGAEAAIRIASAIDPGWLEPTDVRLEHSLVDGRVRAVERTFYGEIALTERPAPPDPEEAARLLSAAWLARGWRGEDLQTIHRIRFAELAIDEEALVTAAAAGCRSLEDIDVRAALDRRLARELDVRAPDTIPVPSGRTVRLTYPGDGSVVAPVKLQELFGLAETPRLGPRRTPVTFELLAPNGRAVQKTSDLRSFWSTGYPAVRKELRGRYPRHPWPEDPWTAPATHRTKPRPRR